MYIIYCHTNRLNGKRYVGYTELTMEKRWERHVLAANQNKSYLLSRAIRKYGVDAWDHDVICNDVQNRTSAKLLERHFIEMLNTYGPLGYNMTLGGDGGGMLGHSPTPEHRSNLSKALAGKTKSASAKKNMSLAKTGEKHPFFGKRRPSHVGVKISKALSGEKAPNAKLTEGEKVAIRDRWANRYVTKVTQHQLAQEHGVTQSTISRLVRGKTWKT